MLTPEIEAALRQLAGAFAGPDPLPAGGAAGVAAIAMGVGLGAKVLRLSAREAADLVEAAGRLDQLLERLLPELAADCAAFSAVLAARRRPRVDAERDDAIGAAWRDATAAPVSVAVAAREAEALLARHAGRVAAAIAGDLGAALELVRAGRRIAESNARENAQHLAPETAREVLAPLERDQ